MTDRCPTCGGRRVTWSPDRILDAAHEWAKVHGEPPKRRDWATGARGPNYPGTRTVSDVFGSWNAMIEAAGFAPRQRGGRDREWTRAAATQALFEWVFAHGRLPQKRDWRPSRPDRPSSDQMVLLFGSWNAFLASAGYEPLRKMRSLESYHRQAGAALRDRTKDGAFV